MSQIDGISYSVVTWDWKAQINLDALRDALIRVYNGDNVPAIYNVDDTGGDQYAIVVASRPFREARHVADAWEQFYEGGWRK
jgi:hypothetical protein